MAQGQAVTGSLEGTGTEAVSGHEDSGEAEAHPCSTSPSKGEWGLLVVGLAALAPGGLDCGNCAPRKARGEPGAAPSPAAQEA